MKPPLHRLGEVMEGTCWLQSTEAGRWDALLILCRAMLAGVCTSNRQTAAASDLTTSQTTHSVLSRQGFDVCSFPFWLSLSKTLMSLDLPGIQSFRGLGSSAAGWPWEPSQTRSSTAYFVPHLLHGWSYCQLCAGPSKTSSLDAPSL